MAAPPMPVASPLCQSVPSWWSHATAREGPLAWSARSQICATGGNLERVREEYQAALAILGRMGERLYAERIERALVMLLCLLVYRLAEHRRHQQLAVAGQTIPSQVNKPTDRPTMRWVFQCFEGVDLLHIRHGPGPAVALVLRLQPLHQQVLALLGPTYEEFYKSTN